MFHLVRLAGKHYLPVIYQLLGCYRRRLRSGTPHELIPSRGEPFRVLMYFLDVVAVLGVVGGAL
jgi:hypothetical protein